MNASVAGGRPRAAARHPAPPARCSRCVPLAWFWRRAPRRRARAAPAGVRLVRALPQLRPGPARRLHPSQRFRPRLPRLARLLRPRDARSGASAPIAAAQAAGADRRRHREQGVDRDGCIATARPRSACWCSCSPRQRCSPRGARGGAVRARWAIATLVWICLQGAFGALTVAMRLYPAIVTLHLLGGLGLLALLAIQAERYAPTRAAARAARCAPASSRSAALAIAQIALGGWVSSNYAVLACRDFPTCQGALVARHGLRAGLRRAPRARRRRRRRLSAVPGADRDPHGASPRRARRCCRRWSSFAWRLRRAGAAARPWALALLAIAAWQAASGLGNVLLGWPLAAAVAHTAGAAALVVVLTRPDRAQRTRCARCSLPSRPAAQPRWLRRIGSIMSRKPSRRSSRRAASLPRQAAPVLRADQAARGAADRLLRRDRHAARHARPARLAPGARARSPASGWSPRPPPRSTAWSSSASTRAWRAPSWRATATGELTSAPGARLLGAARARRQRDPLVRGEPADDVAHPRHLRRLRDRLHGAAEAADAAEHRHRRRVRARCRRCSAGRRSAATSAPRR